MTVLLAAIHAFKQNKGFEPTVLYIATAVMDLSIIDAVFRAGGVS